MPDISRSADGRRRCRTVFARPEFKGPHFQSFMLMAMAGVALSAGSSSAHAGEVNWLGGTSLWGTAANWDTHAVPTSSDTVNVSAGNAGVGNASTGGTFAAGTLNLTGGVVQATAKSTLSAGTINVSGGELRAASSQPRARAGVINVSTLVNITGGLLDNYGNLNVASGGTITQSAGEVTDLHISTPSYTQSGGDNTASVTTSVYNQSGGSMGGVLTTGTYNLTGASATSTGGSISASALFALSPTSGTATVDAFLSGRGNLVKSGASTVVLTNTANNFTGTISIEAGTLEAVDDALPDRSAVSIDDGATLTMMTGNDTLFRGTMTGAGSLIKEDTGTLTVGGNVTLGTLTVNDGRLEVGTGTSGNTAFFGSATIAGGTALHVAAGATLTINTANNAGSIDTEAGASWKGDVTNGLGSLNNNGSWTGDVVTNSGVVNNDGIGAVWTGNVAASDGQIANTNGAAWNGDVLSNNNVIFNMADSTWTGNVVTNGGGSNDRSQIDNRGTWKGDIEKNGTAIYNTGAWEGKILGNRGDILVISGSWTGDIAANTGSIVNAGGVWTGNILGNAGTVETDADTTWQGDVTNGSGTIHNYGSWTGDVVGNNNEIELSGTWNGSVRSNDGYIFNNGGTWNGDIATNTGMVFNAAGGVWMGDVLSNNSNVKNDVSGIWNGNVESNTYVVENHGAWTGHVTSNDGLIVNTDAGAVWTGEVLGNAGTIETDAGTSWKGNVNNGLGTINNYGNWTGEVASNTGAIDNDGIGASWTGDVAASDGQIANKNGAAWNGTVLSNNNAIFNEANSIWTGNVATNAGSIVNLGGNWTGNVASNTGTIDNRAGGTWTGDVADNTGTIDNEGIWNGSFANAGTLNAENRINGTFDNSGILHLTGSLAGISTLTNRGTLNMQGNGPAQTLSAGSITFGPNSVYALDIDAAGNNDQVAVTGTAALDGTIRIAAAGTTYEASSVYTIVTAGSVTGEFQSVTTDLTFMVPQMNYSADAVKLTLLRNDVGFVSVGTTPNQRATGAGVETLGAGNPLYNTILWLNADQAAHAFDNLSGEAYSSVEGVYVQNAGLLADILSDRMDEAFDAPTDGGTRIASNDEGFVPSVTPGRSTRLWSQIYGKHASVGSDGNTAGMDSTTGGFAGGFDGLVSDWRLGLMFHIGRSRSELSVLNSSADSTDYGAGVYGGRQWGRTRLSLGANYTRHDISSDRHIAFSGVAETESTDYSSGTAQVFGKLSQQFDLELVSLSPYASLAYVRDNVNGFTETGGAAALSSSDSHLDATFTTIGLGAARKFLAGNNLHLTARGKLGWRHTFADAPGSSHHFADGADFSVSGAPIDGDAIVAVAGLDINAVSSLDVSYEGSIGGSAQGHALTGTWSMRF